MNLRRATYLFLFIVLWIVICPVHSSGQNLIVDTGDEISRSLVKMGMEDVVVADEADALYIKYSDNVYRGTFRGTFEALSLLLDDLHINKDIVLLLQEDRIPYIAIKIDNEQVDAYFRGYASLAGLMSAVYISYDIDEYNEIFKGIKSKNNSAGKIDIVLYPQLSLNNSWKDKLYVVIFNIAPAIEIGLWKGASITGQVIFPLWDNISHEGYYLRPGMLLFRQEHRFPKNIFMTFNIGNFNANRMGTDLSLRYTPGNNRWEAGINAGITGSSYFDNWKWELSTWRRMTGAVFFSYNVPSYNLQFNLSGQRYVYEDYGVRLDCTRHFGEVSVGFFGMYTREANGGFHITAPLPGKKRAKRKMIRITAPEYIDLEYKASTGSEFNQVPAGYYYETRPDANRSQRYYNPDYIKEMLVKLASEKN